jgi:hypothetical protein
MQQPPSAKRQRVAGGAALSQQAQARQVQDPETSKLLLMLSKMNGPERSQQGARAQM